MKKLGCVMSVVLAVVWVSGAAGALPPVELKPDCGYVFNALSGSPPGFDAACQQLVALLVGLGVEMPMADWEEADLETFNDEVVGDGVPDYYQIGMLGAALCAGDPVLLSQFNANVAAVNNLAVQVGAAVAADTPVNTEMATVGNLIMAWAMTLPDSDPIKWDAYYVGSELVAFSERTYEELLQYAPLFTSMIPLYANFLAGMAGLSTEMNISVNKIEDGLFKPIDWPTGCNPGLKQMLAWSQDDIDYLLYVAEPVMPPDLVTQCNTLKAHVDEVIPVVNAIVRPNVIVFGAGRKGGNEPFSGDGDYNGDGITNKRVYELVTAAGGDRFAFVQAAAGGSPFWPGNPGLPAAGVFGTALTILLCGLAGARKAGPK